MVNHKQRAEEFSKLFTCSTFGIPERFFEETSKKKLPVFQLHCGAVLDAFEERWKLQSKRGEYLLTFTRKRWRKLAAAAEKANYTLENCTACALQHEDIQETFPGPTFKPGLHSIYETATTSRKDEKAVTKKVLQHVNASHTVCNKYTVSSTVKITLCLLSYTQDKYGHALTESAVALFPELHLAKKPTPNEARALKCKRDRQVRNQENETLAKIIPRQILASSTASVSSYLNRRREQNFIRPQQPGKVKSHSPADTSHWDVPSAMDMLRNWPQNSTINWSA